MQLTEGLTEGRGEEKLEIARNALVEKWSFDVMQKITELFFEGGKLRRESIE